MSREDDPFAGLLQSLGEALDQLDIGDPSTRDAIGTGVKDALSGLFQQSRDEASEARPGPEVVVLDGGRDEQAADASQTEPPDLEVVSRTPAEEDSAPRVQVSVLPLSTRPLGEDGRWQVKDESQVVYSGPTARRYRIGCARGEASVRANGLEVTVLRVGRTVDVEATLLELSGTGAGAYRAL